MQRDETHRIVHHNTHTHKTASWEQPKLLLLALVTMMTILVASPLSSGQAQPANLVWLHVDGNRIVTETGSARILRGVAVVDPYVTKYLEKRWSSIEADLREISQNWRANAIHVTIMPDFYHYGHHSGQYSEELLDPIVDLGSKYGLYVILAWHAHGNPITGQAEADPWTGREPYHGNPCDPNLALALQFWQDVAERYKNDPWVLYSIFNEPNHLSWTEWRPVAEQLVDAIRSHNPRALILVSGVNVAYDLKGVANDPVQRDNIVYEVHPYPGQLKWFGSWEDNFGYLSSRYPIFAGEWGFEPGNPEWDGGVNGTVENYGKPLRDYLNSKGMSWTAWIWSASWGPAMLRDWQYQPTAFGQFVKNALLLVPQRR